MAIMRSDSHLNISAPPPSPRGVEPPSPIPTAAGSRSAANPVLSQFLDKSLHVPDLASPLPHFLVTTRHHQIPDEINLRLLVEGDAGSVDRLLKSAHEFGAFRIKFHGISVEELRSLVRQAERVFGILEGIDTGSRRGSGGRNGNKDEIVWVRSGKERMEWARECIGAELFHSFSEKMENVSSRLDAIAEQLGQVFVEHLGKQSSRRTQEKQSTLSMYKYNQDIINEQSSASANVMNKLRDHVLSLHLPTKKCKYWMQSGPTPFSFNAGPDTIVVSVGKQLEEWSLGEFKCVLGEYIFQPTDPQTSFSIELKYSSVNIKQQFNRTLKTVTIADQILIALILALLYSIFKFLWS